MRTRYVVRFSCGAASAVAAKLMVDEWRERAGITLPLMYRLGYHNANCIGCVKGGEGYWNKIRHDFPERFIQISDIQESIGPGAYLFRDRVTGERYGLKDLPLDKGRYQDEPEISCGFLCAMVEDGFGK